MPAAAPPPVNPAVAVAASAAVERARKDEASRVVRAYADSHAALDTERRAPTAAELAAAEALTEPPDPGVDSVRWKTLSPAARLSDVFQEHRHQLWLSACRAGIGQWWERAHAIDDELAARLEHETIPQELYAGIAAWNRQWDWLKSRQASETGTPPQLVDVGAVFRLISAQNRWAEGQPPLEHAVSELYVPDNSWSLEERAAEQSRFCTAADGHGPYTWPIGYGIKSLHEGSHVVRQAPARESGTVAQIRKQGTEWLVTRRDWTTLLELVPPCHVEKCHGIDCCMGPGGCSRNVCTEKRTQQFSDHAFVLHFEALPVALKVGDFVDFHYEPTSGHAVLITASKNANQLPYFALDMRRH